MSRTLAVAGLSARLMAEAAAADGFEVFALDLFGDVDTCAAATRWFCIGEPAEMRIDGPRLLAALEVLARRGDVLGWVAGSGFEGCPELLAQGNALLPLIGTAPAAQARLRDPGQFFAALDELDVDHPPVRLSPPADDSGNWLLKDLHGSGGGHIRRLVPGQPAALAPGQYLQRQAPGQSLSATFVASGQGARLLGINRLIVRERGASPYVYCGVVGPVPVAAAMQRRLQSLLTALSARFELRGLASLDFLRDGDHVQVLEINPRPSASMASYADAYTMAAHVHACLHGELPALRTAAGPCQGQEIVFAHRPLRLDSAQVQALVALPPVHDLPGPGQPFATGDPLCSVSASGADADQVLALLQARREALLQSLENPA